MFDFAAPRPRRRPNLTPMIDVVFLLLVFFMLASRFGHSGALPLATSGAASAYRGPPRLIEVAPDALRLNGAPLAEAALAGALAPLMTRSDDIVVLRPAAGATLQRLVTVMAALRAAGFGHLVLLEAADAP